MWLLLLLFAVDANRCDTAIAELRMTRARRDGDAEIWVSAAASKPWHVLAVNRGGKIISANIVWKETGLPIRRGSSPRVLDEWGQEDRGKVHGGFAQKLEPGGCALFRVEP